MKKIVKKIIVILAILISILILSKKVNAATINLDYNTMAGNEKSNNLKIYPGDEVYLSISINDDEDEKIMAMYGILEYDKDVLELIPYEDNKEEGEVILNHGWSRGNITIKNGRFMLYSTDENRDNTVAYIKFKAKEDINVDSTNIVAKELVVYNNNYKEVSTKIDDISLEIQMNQNKRLSQGSKTFIIIVLVLAGFIILIFIMIKKEKIIIRRATDNKNNKIDENENINPMQTKPKKKTNTRKKSENKNQKNEEKR